MIKINWDEYKDYKKYNLKDDNFIILLNFIKSYYNISNIFEVFEILQADETARMMLQKRRLKDAQDLENFIFNY